MTPYERILAERIWSRDEYLMYAAYLVHFRIKPRVRVKMGKHER
jgi:hypothetical protein